MEREQLLDKRRVFLITVVIAMVYIAVALLNVDDLSFLLYSNFLSVGVALPVSGGYITLPGLTQSISTFQFFLGAPLVVVGLHGIGARVALFDLGPIDELGPVDQLLVSACLFGPPVMLLALARSYAPFAGLPPEEDGGFLRYWLVFLHQGLIMLDWSGLLLFYTLARGDRGAAAARRRRDLVDAVAVLAAAAACLTLAAQILDLGGDGRPRVAQTEEARWAVFVASALASPLLFLALEGRFPLGLLRWLGRSRQLLAGSVDLFGQDFVSLRARRIPMSLRLAAAAFALIATVQIGHTRPIDVSNRQIAARMPSETIIAAYISRSAFRWDAGEQDELSAWERALRDHARGANLANWRLARANFTRAVMPKASLQGANLEGAVFDFALLAGSDLTGVQARRSSFRYVDFSIQLAQADTGAKFDGAKLNGADFSNADLRNANFENAALTNAKFVDAELNEAVFSRGADIAEDGDIVCAELSLTHPDGLTGVEFTKATLDGAYLDGVDFTKLGDVSGASFRKAHLRCAKVDCAMFGAADLSGVDARGATFFWSSFTVGPETLDAERTAERNKHCPTANEGTTQSAPPPAN